MPYLKEDTYEHDVTVFIPNNCGAQETCANQDLLGTLIHKAITSKEHVT